MPIPTTCPGCKAVYRLGDVLAGKEIHCPACGRGIIVGPVPAPPVPKAAQVIEAPSSPAKPKPRPPRPSSSPKQPAARAPKAAAQQKERPLPPPVKRRFPTLLVAIGVVVALGVLFTGTAVVGAVVLYFYVVPSASSVAQSDTTPVTEGQPKSDAGLTVSCQVHASSPVCCGEPVDNSTQTWSGRTKARRFGVDLRLRA